jgi:TPR repeat protein
MGNGESRRMIATANQHARDGGWLVRATRRLAFALALAALCLASGAKADAVSAGKRAFARHDYVRAASLLFVEAERGSPVAQTYLGYMYQYGLGVPRDYVLAASWLHQAAEQGEPTGQFLLGLLFDKGYGVPVDWVEAEVWLNLAAAHAEARQQDYFARVRDAVAQKLTLDQLAETQRRASAWAPIGSRSSGPLSARF